MLEGERVVIDGNGEHRLTAGMYAAFPAGEADAHHLCKHSSAPARLLAIGRGHRGAVVIHYPHDNLTSDGPVPRDENGDRIASL